MPDPTPVCSVRLFFPSRPEHFAYLVHEKFRPDTRTVQRRGVVEVDLAGVFVTLTDIATVSRRELTPAWFFKAGGRLVHPDGRPYTDEELDARFADPAAVNEALGRFSCRRLSSLT